MNSIKVSVLISNFNKEKYIEESLKSCLSQEYENIEIIVFDNISTDNSLKILNKFEDRVKINFKKRVSSIASANQTDVLIEAFKISSGDLICLLDSDDYFISKKIKTIVQKFSEDKKLQILFDVPRINNNGRFEALKIKKKVNKYTWPSTIPTSGISLRRDFFHKCLEFDLFSNYPRLEIDFKLNFFSQIITKNYKILDEFLTFYRYVDGGIMANSKKFSQQWWLRRMQAHYFIQNIYLKNNIKYIRNYDFFITKLIVKFLKKDY
jgi:glycosyltransferase involved in cell wall biosynthesis